MSYSVSKKALSLVISFSLIVPNIALAAQNAGQKTQTEIKQALTAPERYSKTSAAEYIAWGMGVLAAGAIGYKAGHFLGDIKGFGRGFDAAGGFAARDLTAKQAAAIGKLERQVIVLQEQLLSASTTASAEDNVIRLIVRLNSQLSALKQRRTKEEVSALKRAIERTISEIPVAEVKDPSTRRILSKFITQAEKSLGKKGLVMALASLFASVAVAIVVSGEGEKYDISSSRVIVSRQLAQAFEAGPQVFTLKTLYLKQKYGVEVVSSVIYENQSKYYPALQSQLAMFENQENRLLADFITKGAAYPAQQYNKDVLLNSIKKASPLNYQSAF